MRQTDDVVVVAIDIDANEDARAVRDHIASNDFAGTFAISPQELTQALVGEYGTGVVNPPSSPKILVNAAQTETTYFDGVKTADELRSLANEAR